MLKPERRNSDKIKTLMFCRRLEKAEHPCRNSYSDLKFQVSAIVSLVADMSQSRLATEDPVDADSVSQDDRDADDGDDKHIGERLVR